MKTILIICSIINGCVNNDKEPSISEINKKENNLFTMNDYKKEAIVKEKIFVVEYVEKLKIDENKISQLPSHAQKMLKEQLSEPKKYLLETDGKHSIYQRIFSEEKENKTNQSESFEGNKKVIRNTNITSVGATYYKDLEAENLYKKTDLKGDEFVVKVHNTFQNLWKITSETKKIGTYTAIKAVLEDNNKETVTAWYVAEIPITDGPELYNGLPGLIVELETNKKHIILKSLNEKEGNEISLPSFSKTLTMEEYNKKMDEMKVSNKRTTLENSSGVKRNTTIIKSE